jgi:type I restriction enzyme S subunit
VTWYGTTDLPVTSFKQMFEVTLGKMLQTEQAGPSDSMTPYLNSAAVQDGYVEDSNLKSMWASDTDRRNLSLRADDLVVCEGGDVGRSALVKAASPAIFQNSVHRVRPRRGNDIRFAKYTLDALRNSSYLDVLCNKATIRHFTADKLANLEVPLASPSYQTAACDYLDRETVQIDDLIGKQERLIQLLAEKRQAIITQAVTKGLDPTAPTKPSGIPKLGDIPAHWNVTTVKRLASIISKGTTPTTVGAEFTDDGIRFLKAENIQNHTVKEAPENFISAETNLLLARSKLQPNDLLVVIAGATTGKSAILTSDLTPSNTNQAVAFVRPRDPVVSRWIHHVLTTPRVENLIASLSVQSAQPNLSLGDLGSIWLPLPPAPEIDRILDHMSRSMARLDELTVTSARGIELLRERRSALISAAVTGKIDVREGASQP